MENHAVILTTLSQFYEIVDVDWGIVSMQFNRDIHSLSAQRIICIRLKRYGQHCDFVSIPGHIIGDDFESDQDQSDGDNDADHSKKCRGAIVDKHRHATRANTKTVHFRTKTVQTSPGFLVIWIGFEAALIVVDGILEQSLVITGLPGLHGFGFTRKSPRFRFGCIRICSSQYLKGFDWIFRLDFILGFEPALLNLLGHHAPAESGLLQNRSGRWSHPKIHLFKGVFPVIIVALNTYSIYSERSR